MCILLKYDRNIATRGQKTCARQDGRINNTLQPGQPDFVKIQPVQPDSALFFPLDTTQVGLSGRRFFEGLPYHQVQCAIFVN